jgi:hypothetical protein
VGVREVEGGSCVEMGPNCQGSEGYELGPSWLEGLGIAFATLAMEKTEASLCSDPEAENIPKLKFTQVNINVSYYLQE